jgi:hypothetical protein
MSDHCFDITEQLGEKPVELVVGHVGTERVLCAARKSLANGLHVSAMWEVKNGLHIKSTVSMVTVPATEASKSIDSLWLLFGDDSTNLQQIRMNRQTFHSSDKFWEKVESLGLSHAISRSRLSPKMQQQLKTEAERLG